MELPDWDGQSKGYIEVYDLRGARIFNKRLEFGTGTEILNTKNWSPSVYMVVLRVNGEVRDYSRLVIQR